MNQRLSFLILVFSATLTFLSAQDIQEQGFTHSLVAIVPGAPSYGFGALAVDNNGDVFLAAANDPDVYRLRSGESGFSTFVTLPGGAGALSLAGDTMYAASGNDIYTVDLLSPAPVAVFAIEADSDVLSLAATLDPRNLSVGLSIGQQYGAEFIELPLGTSMIVADQGSFSAVVPQANDSFLATDNSNNSLVTFSPPTFGSSMFLPNTRPGPDGLVEHPFVRDLYIACSGSDPGLDAIQKLDASTGQLTDFITGLDLHDDRRATPMAFTPDGSRLYYGSIDFGVFLIHAIDGFSSQVDLLRASLNPALEGSSQYGDVEITFDAESTRGLNVSATFEFSVDGGMSYQPCSGEACSPTSNPTGSLGTSALGESFVWNSFVDGVGLSMNQPVEFRMTASDGELSVEQSVSFGADNHVWNSFTDTLCGSWSTGDMDISFDADSFEGFDMRITNEFSTDGGMSFDRCAKAASSPTGNPSLPLATPILATGFVWNSFVDGVGLLSPNDGVILRMSADDGITTIVRNVTIGVDNSPSVQTCQLCGDCDGNGSAADILDGLVAAQLVAGLLGEVSPSQLTCCDVNDSGNLDIVDGLLMAQNAAGLGVMLSCP